MNEMAVKGIWGEGMERVLTTDGWEHYRKNGDAWVFFDQSKSTHCNRRLFSSSLCLPFPNLPLSHPGPRFIPPSFVLQLGQHTRRLHADSLVAIIDRWATHRHNPVAEQWNKMLLPIFQANPPTHFFEPARQSLLETYHIHPPHLASKHLPKVLYIDRQSTDRRLNNETHDALLDLFGEFGREGRMEFGHVLLEDLTPHQQIEVVAYADVSTQAIQVEMGPASG